MYRAKCEELGNWSREKSQPIFTEERGIDEGKSRTKSIKMSGTVSGVWEEDPPEDTPEERMTRFREELSQIRQN